MQFTAIVDGDAVHGALEYSADATVHANVGGRQYAIQIVAAEPNIYWIKLEDRSLEVVVVHSSEGYSVSIGSARFQIEIENARSRLRRTVSRGHDGAAAIKAPMPGKIVRLLATEGAEVHAHQGIVIMEAMKMQNEIKSPKAGTVKRILVAEGAAVNGGDLLATIE